MTGREYLRALEAALACFIVSGLMAVVAYALGAGDVAIDLHVVNAGYAFCGAVAYVLMDRIKI